jgi:hypothetical protein
VRCTHHGRSEVAAFSRFVGFGPKNGRFLPVSFLRAGNPKGISADKRDRKSYSLLEGSSSSSGKESAVLGVLSGIVHCRKAVGWLGLGGARREECPIWCHWRAMSKGSTGLEVRQLK